MPTPLKASVIGLKRQNRCTNYNANPTDTTGLSGGGVSVTTVVDDTSNLQASGIYAKCPSGKVFKTDNSAGGASVFVNVIGPADNLGLKTFSVWWRGGNGAIDGSSNVPTPVTGTANYIRNAHRGQRPTSASAQPFLRIDAGQVVFWILNQFEDGSHETAEIEVRGAAKTVYA